MGMPAVGAATVMATQEAAALVTASPATSRATLLATARPPGVAAAAGEEGAVAAPAWGVGVGRGAQCQ
jgi:hypothetical protein